MIALYAPTFYFCLVKYHFLIFFLFCRFAKYIFLIFTNKPNKNKIKHKKCNRKKVIGVHFLKIVQSNQNSMGFCCTDVNL